VWSDNDAKGLEVYNTYAYGWDFGIGSVYETNANWSTIDVNVVDCGAPSDFYGGSVTYERSPKPTGSQTLYGDQYENFLRGGDSNDLLFGASGFDDLMGGGSADTFLFFDRDPTDGGFDRLINFQPGTDKIRIDGQDGMVPTGLQYGPVATGSSAVLLYIGTEHMLYYHHNGSAAGGVMAVAYVWNTPTWSDIVLT
jgi:Ca2+-binding RTX toxin-like protein